MTLMNQVFIHFKLMELKIHMKVLVENSDNFQVNGQKK